MPAYLAALEAFYLTRPALPHLHSELVIPCLPARDIQTGMPACLATALEATCKPLIHAAA